MRTVAQALSFRVPRAPMLTPVLCGLLAGTSLLLARWLPAQTLAPQPITTETPAPSPEPTATPVSVTTPAPTSTPQATLTLGLPDPSVMAAYFSTRTPLVGVALGTVTNPAAPATAILQTMLGGACQPIVLPRPASAGSPTMGVTAQPVATVVLTYNAGYAGKTVWVQMLQTGTLIASDGAGHTYDGSQGFFLTLDANAMATFDYQAPNVGGTYQVYTRLENVATVLPFFVPDPAPSPAP